MPYNRIVMPMQFCHERIRLFQSCGTSLHRFSISMVTGIVLAPHRECTRAAEQVRARVLRALHVALAVLRDLLSFLK